MKNDQPFWNFAFTLFFGLLVLAGMWVLYSAHAMPPRAIPLFDFVLLCLAAFRLTRLFVYDKITEFVRQWFSERIEVVHDTGVTTVIVQPYPSGPLRTIADLLGCPWCFGIWSAFMVTFFYYLTPFAWYPILLLAVAGVGTVLQIGINAVGWKAENLKYEAREREARAD